jgi:cyanophycinase-like exopeptidase
MTRLLVIMGSGETAPTMVKPHRAIFERLGEAPAVLLDTPYGFQSNADDISARAAGYFATSVGRRVDVVSWREAPPPGLARERALATLRQAGWVFAGPGSPTYALRQWRETPVPGLLAEILQRDGVVVFASAAALTLGSHTVPVYEIYKAGFSPHWVAGLDLVADATGLPAVVIPHYDNAEGGHHDTRFCYLGEQRLSVMERELPEDSFVLGVDEHTAVVLDLDAKTASVIGNGVMTIRRRGRSIEHRTGSIVPFSVLGEVGEGSGAAGAGRGDGTAAEDGARSGSGARAGADRAPGAHGGSADASESQARTRVQTSLRAAADQLQAEFDAALDRRDVDGCVSAVLDLEQTLLDWSADTLTSDEGDHARAILRGMLVRLGELAVAGAQDPREVVRPYVEMLLGLRAAARRARDYATSDRIRDGLVEAGVEVRDTPDGVEWDRR